MMDRLAHAWNAFVDRKEELYIPHGASYSHRPDRMRFTRGNDRSIVTSVYNRIAMDVAAISIQHVKLDEGGRFLQVVESGLNSCLTLEANIDQTGRAFVQDIVLSMLDEGCVAIVPVDTDVDPTDKTGGYSILSMRTGKILEWEPERVWVRLYNDRTGYKEDIWIPKRMAAIVENPLYAVVNQPNSTMQRLIHKLNLLDVLDNKMCSGKLDLIIQLPYTIRSESKRQQAELRRQSVEEQLTGSAHGIAYTDGTEKVIQLNRPVDNNLMTQIEYLTSMLYSQLGITDTVMNGTADEKTMLNYYSRTTEPIIAAIADEIKRKFLTKTARTQRQSIQYFDDPFRLVPVSQLAEIADKFTRNEILSSNEIRQYLGIKPSKDPKADELKNKNLASPNSEPTVPKVPLESEGRNQNE